MKPQQIYSFALATSLVFASIRTVAQTGKDHRSQVPSVVVTADFKKGADYPLSKTKFGVFNSGLVKLPHYDRDIGLYDEVRPHLLRVDLWWGGGPWQPQPVAGDIGNIEYNFGEIDHIAHLLNAHKVLPCWSYCYVPPPLQPRPGDWRRITNPKVWGEILGAFARHAREGGPEGRIGYHEIYNEPDNRDFFRGSRADYFAMYREGSRAIRAIDSDAMIGGPALAFTPEWVDPFLDMARAEQLPLDFFSFHFYPRCWGTNTVRDVVEIMRAKLSQHPELATTAMHLNEFNSYAIDYPRLGSQDRHAIASAMFHDYEWFLSQPDLAQISWAQFQDTAGGNWSGMISFEGKRKALFNAAAIYARMPVDRRPVVIKGSRQIGAMASADADRAGLLIWNRSSSNQLVRARLLGISFRRGDVRVYRIDAEHSSWGDNPDEEQLRSVESRDKIRTDNLDWTGLIPSGGVLYVEANNTEKRVLTGPPPSAQMVRLLNYYPNRRSRAYADFDCHDWTARLGMGPENNAVAQVGVVADGLERGFAVRAETDGKLRSLSKDSVFALRIDYLVGTNYVSSVMFHGHNLGSKRSYDSTHDAAFPWGTRRRPDHVVAVKDFSRFHVDVQHTAPPEWTGRIAISFLMRNTGKGSRAKISLLAE